MSNLLAVVTFDVLGGAWLARMVTPTVWALLSRALALVSLAVELSVPRLAAPSLVLNLVDLHIRSRHLERVLVLQAHLLGSAIGQDRGTVWKGLQG